MAQGALVATTHPNVQAAPAWPSRLSLGDLGFLLALVLAMVAVVLSGRFAYHQGTLLESAKANAQAVAWWVDAVAGADKDGPLTLALCGPAPAAAEAAKPVVWSQCRDVLFVPDGRLAGLVNPFDVHNPVIGSKCETKAPAVRGAVVLEKGVPTAPGLPPGTLWSPLMDDEPLVHGLALRVHVCDGGGYPIRIAELKL